MQGTQTCFLKRGWRRRSLNQVSRVYQESTVRIPLWLGDGPSSIFSNSIFPRPDARIRKLERNPRNGGGGTVNV